jgi:hypothetical protein
MADNTLREFIVSLGWKSDEASQRNFVNALETLALMKEVDSLVRIAREMLAGREVNSPDTSRFHHGAGGAGALSPRVGDSRGDWPLTLERCSSSGCRPARCLNLYVN